MKSPPLFERFRERAARLVESGGDVAGLLKRAAARIERQTSARLMAVRDDFKLILSLVRAWYAGEYREIDQSSIVVLLAAVLYFLVPLDAVPDFIVGFGLIDDAAVIAYVISSLRAELDRFKLWQEATATKIDNKTGGEDLDGGS